MTMSWDCLLLNPFCNNFAQFIKLKKGLPLVTASVVVIFDKCELVFQVFHLYLTLRGGAKDCQMLLLQ